jgi:hypothetical protein
MELAWVDGAEEKAKGAGHMKDKSRKNRRKNISQ